MRSALALSALLLLLLLTPPSLSQDDGGQPASGTDASTTTIKPTTDPSKKYTAPAPMATTTAATTAHLRTDPATSRPTAPVLPGQTASPAVTKGLTVTSAPTSVVSTSLSTKQSVDSPTGTVGGSQGSSTKHPSSTLKPQAPSSEPTSTQTQSGKEAVTGGQGSEPPTASPTMTTAGKGRMPPQPTDMVSTAKPSLAPAATSPASPEPLTQATSKAPESSPKEPHSLTPVPSSASPMSGPSLTPIPPGTLGTQAPPGTSQGTLQSSTQMPASPTPSSSTTPQPARSSSETVTTPAVSRPTVSSTSLASTAPQSPRTPSPTLDHRNITVKCLPAEGRNEKLLILNLTEASPCAKSSPPDDRLVALLCQAGKPTFDPAQDWCDVQLAPIQGDQAVAVHKITIQTNLHSKDVYELLKDKWDELRDVGVSDMQLGNEGPPEEPDDRFSMPLIITIVCMASFLLLIAALYGCCHQRLSQRKDQQRLTEELQTVENGYHDNPTLEVMETSSEMQEKKVVNLNGELGDSWIVPLDNMTKDDLDEEEDTHL